MLTIFKKKYTDSIKKLQKNPIISFTELYDVFEYDKVSDETIHAWRKEAKPGQFVTVSHKANISNS